MRIKVTQILETPVTLPLGYHHIIQGVIYNAVSTIPGYEDLHDIGYSNGSRLYRMFNYSELFGRYQIKGTRITFTDQIMFFVSSPNVDIVLGIANSFANDGICWGDTYGGEVTVEFVESPEMSSEWHIKMLSPLCLAVTDFETRKTTFVSPGDRDFSRLMQENYERKYEAYYGEKPDNIITISPVMVLPKDARRTWYKNNLIEGWTGEYRLSGTPQALEFLYDTGIGSKNSKGFGLFDIVAD